MKIIHHEPDFKNNKMPKHIEVDVKNEKPSLAKYNEDVDNTKKVDGVGNKFNRMA